MNPKICLHLAIFFYFPQIAHAQETPKQRHNYESISVEYEITGDSKGTAKLKTCKFGWKEKWEHKFEYSIYGLSSREHKLTLRDQNTIYEVDMISKTGKKKTDKKTSALLSYKDPVETKQALLTGDGGEIMRTDSILGRKVNVWMFENSPTTEVWEWQGIILKQVKKVGNLNYNIIATSIDLDAGIAEQEFNLPEDVSFN